MEWTKFLIGGAALGAVAGLWNQIKAVVWKLCNLLLDEVEIRDPMVAAAVVGHLANHYRRLGMYRRSYTGVTDHHIRDGERRFGLIPCERYMTQALVLGKRGWPLFFSAGGTSPGAAEGSATSGQKTVNAGAGKSASLFFIRGTHDADKIISDAVREWNQVAWELSDKRTDARRRFCIKYIPDVSKENVTGPVMSSWQYYSNIRLLDTPPQDIGLGARQTGSALERLYFPPQIEELIEEVKIWRKSQAWYQSRGIPWKHGWLLHGKPGTGKTALASAFAYDLDMPIFVYNLADLGNTEFIGEWKSMLASVPCIALIEDMDTVFHGRENVIQEPSFQRQWRRIPTAAKVAGRGSRTPADEADIPGRSAFLSFDVLLNCIDGVDRAEGVFTIITTNHVDKIDPALGQPVQQRDGDFEFVSTRPGRIDRAVELVDMEPSVKKRMAKHILGDFKEELDRLLRHIDMHPEERGTAAQFQQRCNAIAMKCFWKRERAVAGASDESATNVLSLSAASQRR